MVYKQNINTISFKHTALYSKKKKKNSRKINKIVLVTPLKKLLMQCTV